MQGQTSAYSGLKQTLSGWWQRVRGFDRRWTLWSLAALGACLVGWLVYASSRQGLEQYLQQVDFDQATAASIASFSYGQVGWFVLTLAVAIGLITLVLSGFFKGRRAKWGGILLGLFLVLDLGRANQPWIIVWNYPHKYATNPVIDMLREKPYEQRVAILPGWFTGNYTLPPQLETQQRMLGYLYGIEWTQHLFLYYDIQSLDVIQMPRKPQDLTAYDYAFVPLTSAQLPRLGRQWELTNTRYLIGLAGFLPVLNQTVDPTQHSFRYKERFAIGLKPGAAPSNDPSDWTAVPDTNGPFAVFEFTGALPRAKLYSNWELEPTMAAAAAAVQTNSLSRIDLQVLSNAGTNGFVTLQKLASLSFDPQKTVIVAPPPNGSVPNPGTASADTGKVEFAKYAPKDLVLKTEATAPSVLLLNDHYDPNWKVLVDGKAGTLLRCNYLMQGVFLQPGSHVVEFLFQPPMGSFYVSLAGVGLGVLLCGLLLVVSKGPPAGQDVPEAENTLNGRAETRTNQKERKGPKVAGAPK